MSTAYYYFAASLPMLEFGVSLPCSCEEFLQDCERLLSAEDYADILSAVSDDARLPRNRVLILWQEFQHNFRNEMAWVRANEFNVDAADHIRGIRVVEPEVVDALAQAIKSDNPLNAEKILDQVRWQKLEELGKLHYFDMDFLMVYALKLKILERYALIESHKGVEILEELKENVVSLEI